MIETFIRRMKKLGIDIELVSNVPWIYIHKINGQMVTEKFHAKHGFTAFWVPVRTDVPPIASDITEIFKLIRKYTNNEKVNRKSYLRTYTN